jgi:thiamine-phosphate pyrophosphorylase
MIRDYSLYLVSGEEYSNGKSTVEIAKQAIAGGIDILQMREKDKSKEQLTQLGKELSKLCKKNDVLFIVNDYPEIVNEIGADGVHVGQEDIKEKSVQEIRKIIGKDKIIGVSTHNTHQFKKANDMDVDYIAFGPLFFTKTKDYTIGTEDIESVLSLTEKPVIFIGGINQENIDSVLKKGVKNIAVIRAITQAENITEAVKELKEKINSYK